MSHLWSGWGVRLEGVQVRWHHLNKGPLRNFAQSCLDIQGCSAGHSRSGCPGENVQEGGGRRKKKREASVLFIPAFQLMLSNYDYVGLLSMCDSAWLAACWGCSLGNLTSKPHLRRWGGCVWRGRLPWYGTVGSLRSRQEMWPAKGVVQGFWLDGWTAHWPAMLSLVKLLLSRPKCFFKKSAFVRYASGMVNNWKGKFPLKNYHITY